MSFPIGSAFDFANLLFSGPCNAGCPFCIGQQVDPRLRLNNLDEYPPRGLERFIDLIAERRIPQVVLTGANTDPQLYQHEARLLDTLRRRLPPGTQVSLHTNGRLALKKMDIFNQYDRACVSFPSFNPQTYRQVMSVGHPPDLETILRQARIPLKISCVLTGHNLPEIAGFLPRCHALGVRRVVLRKLYGDCRPWDALLPWLTSIQQTSEPPDSQPPPIAGSHAPCLPVPHALRGDALPPLRGHPPTTLTYTGAYRGNPVFDLDGMQITLWDFQRAESRSINLFANGEISEAYLLAHATPVNL